jgi:large subunit ribosomal protein L3
MNQSMGLLGTKLGMTQIFDEDGNVVPVTVVQCGPCTVLRVKNAGSKDGYHALQLGFGARKASAVNKPLAGQFKAAGLEAPLAHVRELRVDEATAGKHAAGTVLKVSDVFADGEKIDVTGTSKGRGFGGVMKRHHFKGFIRSHGTHEFFRHGGSVGTRLTPGMTLRGKRMPGHLGAERVTVQNMVVAKIDPERDLIYVRGGVPGPNGGLVAIRKAVKHEG